jgi:hypothetical protein
MHRRLRYTVIGALLVCGTAASGLVLAADGKGYGAVHCHSGNYATLNNVPGISGSVSLSQQLFYWYGTIYNPWTYTQTLFCPLVKDTTGISSALFVAYDRHETEDVICRLSGEESTGANFWREVEQGETEGYGSSSQTIALPGISAGYDYYALGCSLPPKSGNNTSHLVSYDVQEL